MPPHFILNLILADVPFSPDRGYPDQLKTMIVVVNNIIITNKLCLYERLLTPNVNVNKEVKGSHQKMTKNFTHCASYLKRTEILPTQISQQFQPLFSLNMDIFLQFSRVYGCKKGYPRSTDDSKDPLQRIHPRKLSKKSV